MEFCPGKVPEGEFSTLYPREPAIKSRRSCKADNANMISEDLQGKVAIPRDARRLRDWPKIKTSQDNHICALL